MFCQEIQIVHVHELILSVANFKDPLLPHCYTVCGC